MRRLFPKGQSSPPGVTLVELMIVIVIIGILAAAATPTIRRSQERAAARSMGADIAQLLRTARNQAMSRGEAIYVEILPGNGTTTNRGVVRLRRAAQFCYDGSAPDVNGVCNDGRDARRPRSCRQTVPVLNIVRELDLATRSGDAQLAAVEPGGIAQICFNPDGRVLTTGGNPVGSGMDTVPCEGENMLAIIANRDVDAADASTLATCGVSTDDRDIDNVYRIVVPFNGAITMDQ